MNKHQAPRGMLKRVTLFFKKKATGKFVVVIFGSRALKASQSLGW